MLKQIHKEAATTDFGDKQIAPILRLRLRIFSKTDEFPFGCVAMCSIHWIIEILNKSKTKMLSFYKQQLYVNQIISKKTK